MESQNQKQAFGLMISLLNLILNPLFINSLILIKNVNKNEFLPL